MYSAPDTWPKPGGFPHSEIAGSKVVCHLPDAYRRLPRPSSPLTAKASTVCAYSLDYITRSTRSACAQATAITPDSTLESVPRSRLAFRQHRFGFPKNRHWCHQTVIAIDEHQTFNSLLATLLKSIVMRNHRSVFSAKKLIFDHVADHLSQSWPIRNWWSRGESNS